MGERYLIEQWVVIVVVIEEGVSIFDYFSKAACVIMHFAWNHNFADLALTRFDQVKSFWDLALSLDEVSKAEVNLLHVDRQWHKCFIINIL